MANIKKINKISIACMLFISGCMLIAGCGKKSKEREFTITTESLFTTIAPTTEEVTTASATTTNEVIVFEDTGAPTEITDYEYEEPIGVADPYVDIDLTVLTPNMIYVQVYNMIQAPEQYLGKTIKIRGPYFPLFYDVTGKYYHYVMIKDAQACCQNGMEFVWDEGTHIYPDEYPAEDTEIEIIGTYDVYEEEGYNYYHIDVDEIVVLD